MCSNGVVQIINGASYFMCNITQGGCAFVRFCMTEQKLKPLNQEKCKQYNR